MSSVLMRRWWPRLIAVSLALGASAGWAEDAPVNANAQVEATPAHADLFATVNGKPIPSIEYQRAFANHVRNKFYHGQVPEEQLAAAREEVKNKLVLRVLLLEEAGRRGIVPDEKKVDEAIANYENRYANSPAWKENRERVLPDLRKELAEQNLLQQLEQRVRAVPDATDAEVQAYYDSHGELFTEPEKLRLSVILLGVDPASPSATWQATREEALAIYKRLLAGADFGEASRLHSNSKYAETDGDMGYLHRGMMPEALQEKVDSFQLGKVNEPIDTLEGVAIFRLDDRIPPKKREFADVAQRARELLMRERQEKAWKDLLDNLMASADIKIYQQFNTGKTGS